MDKLGNYSAADIQKYLSPSLTKDTDKVSKGKLAGKIVSNLKEMSLSKFYRIQTLFTTGNWINNKAILKDLDSRIKDLAQDLADKPEKNLFGRELIDHGIKDMEMICKALREAGAKESVLKPVEQDLKALKSVNNYHKQQLPEVAQKYEKKAAELGKTQKFETKNLKAGIQEHGQKINDALKKHSDRAKEKEAGWRENESAGQQAPDFKERLQKAHTSRAKQTSDVDEKATGPAVGKKPVEKTAAEARPTIVSIGGKLKSVIANAYKTTELEHSLGQVVGSISSENRELRGIQNKDFTKMEPKEIKEHVGRAIELITKGLQQDLTVGLDVETQEMPAEIKKQLQELQDLADRL